MARIRIVIPVVSTHLRTSEDLQGMAQPGIDLSIAFIETGPPSIESHIDEAFAVPGMIPLALQAERDKIDGLVIDCMGDPGLAALRETVGIPVLGAAQTSMSVAANLAHRFGVVSVLAKLAPMYHDLADRYGYSRQYVGSRAISVPVLEIHENIEKVKKSLADAALELVQEDGAAAIILGCTGFFGCAEAIRAKLHGAGYDIPVIDPIPTTISIVGAMVHNGLSHSAISYPRDRLDKPMKGYDFPRGN